MCSSTSVIPPSSPPSLSHFLKSAFLTISCLSTLPEFSCLLGRHRYLILWTIPLDPASSFWFLLIHPLDFSTISQSVSCWQHRNATLPRSCAGKPGTIVPAPLIRLADKRVWPCGLSVEVFVSEVSTGSDNALRIRHTALKIRDNCDKRYEFSPQLLSYSKSAFNQRNLLISYLQSIA